MDCSHVKQVHGKIAFILLRICPPRPLMAFRPTTRARTYHSVSRDAQALFCEQTITKGIAGICICAEVNLEGDRSQGKVKGKIREVIDMRALISDLGFSELIRTRGANPDKCWGDS